MAKFCGACGQQLSDASAFCIHCGTPAQSASAPSSPIPPSTPTPPAAPSQPAYSQVNAPAQPAYTPVSAPPPAQPAYAAVNTPPPAQYAPVNPAGGAPPQYPAAPVAKSSGSGLKIVLIVLAVLFMGGLLVVGGLVYVGHRVVKKIEAKAAENGLSLPRDSETATAFHGDACALLSKDDVSAAIGVPIVATHSTGEGCEYMAEGTPADMAAKHLSAMMRTKGATSQQQETIQKMAGGLLSTQQGESKEETQDANATVPVFSFTIDTNSARTQMKLNSTVLGGLEPGSQKIAGIGDEAFDATGAMLMVRKGEKLIRITYSMCPCMTDAIKPLARKLADAV